MPPTDFLTYHVDAARTGWYQGSTVSAGALGTWHKYQTITLNSAVRGAPLFLADWLFQSGSYRGQTHDVMLVGTADNQVCLFADDQLRAGSTAPIWALRLGKPLYRPGSNIPYPLGICSTPVIDRPNQRAFVLALQDDGGTNLMWNVVGNTKGAFGPPNFGEVWDGHHHFWTGDFTGSGKTQVLFYYEGDGNWWLGCLWDGFFGWSLVGNTLGFGQIWDGRPFWIGDFNADGRDDVLFYYPGDDNWWLGSWNGSELSWSSAGNTKGFGHGINDGRPFWIGRFSRSDCAQVLFYYPGDDNWWLGSWNGSELSWSSAGNTKGFGHGINDGRPFWIGDFNADGRDEVLFYYPGDDNWWLGAWDGSKLSWSFAGNTKGFGHGINDGRPFWIGHFTGSGRAELIFYQPGGGYWSFGSCANGVYHMYSLDINSGSVLQQAALNDAGAVGRPTFVGQMQDQRGALNLVANRVYATFADFAAYDLGEYHGWVVSCDANNLGNQTFAATTKNIFGGGAWGPGGVAAAADNSLYVATGNGTTADANYWSGLAGHPGDIGDFFEAVVKLSPDLAILDWYLPTNARQMNDADQDLGGSSPTILPPIAGRQMVVVSGKDGDIYLLDRLNLGHWGGELWRANVFTSESKSTPAYFQTAAGDNYVYVVGSGSPGLVAYKVVIAGSGASLQQAWLAGGAGLVLGDIAGSPIVMGLQGSPNKAAVWIVDDTGPALRGFDAVTGAELFNSSALAANHLGPIPHYPGMSCGRASVFVGTQNGFACYGV